MVKHKGKLFVFEGPDGNGKTSLLDSVFETLNSSGLSVVRHWFPGREHGTLGKHIYQLHHDPYAFGVEKLKSPSLQTLHVAAHIEAIEEFIMPSIVDGKVVLLDRYWWSTVVYSIAYGVSYDQIMKLIDWEKSFWSGVLPECVFLLTREHRPFRLDSTLAEWQNLKFEYDKLARIEAGNYDVHELLNEGTPDELVYKTYNIIRTYLNKDGL